MTASGGALAIALSHPHRDGFLRVQKGYKRGTKILARGQARARVNEGGRNLRADFFIYGKSGQRARDVKEGKEIQKEGKKGIYFFALF